MKNTLLGSVGHRVMQHAAADILVIEGGPFINQEEMVVAIDGSPHSFAGLKKALELARVFEMNISAVAVYDPQFHQQVFHTPVEVPCYKLACLFYSVKQSEGDSL